MNLPFYIAKKYFLSRFKFRFHLKRALLRILIALGASCVIYVTSALLTLMGFDEYAHLVATVLAFVIFVRYYKHFLPVRRSLNFINVISFISMVVVAIGTASLIIALSVFNGLEGLLRSMYGNFDPDIIIMPAKGKSFQYTDEDFEKVSSLAGVLGVSKVIEDNVLLRYQNSQRVVRMKGVGRAFDKYSGIRNVMVAGEFDLVEDSIGYAIIGRGVQYDLSINLANDFYALQLYYPRNIGPGVVQPDRMYKVLNILPRGIFAIEKYYDENYVFVPIEFAQDLLDYENRISSYDVYLGSEADPATVKANLEKILGREYTVLLGDELHSDLYKILKVEKLFVFLILTAIVGIASINIFFSLTMLVIEKRKDITILFVQGASKRLVRNIFVFAGCIVAFSGAAVGLILGLSVSWLQQEYGIIGMGIQSAVMSSYPVEIQLSDVLVTVFAIITITFLASIQPALRASKTYSISSLQ